MAKLKTNEQFIKECIEVHGNKYDYSETFYTGAHNVITIICPIHGSFQQKAYSHVQGCGCLECAGVKKLTTKEFIEKSQKVHGDKFDYSEVDYQGNKLKIKIKCKKCGHIFEQQAQSHMKGFGCPFCSNNNKSTTKEFIEKASKVHGEKYDYSLVNYVNAHTKVNIICPVHGVFQQIPSSHWYLQQGCPICALSKQTSRGEKEVCAYIKSIYSGEVLENDKTQIGRMELDIFLPELRIGIEYNGTHWHKLKEERQPGCHAEKERRCKEANILLINVEERDWKNNRKSIENLLFTKIHTKNKVCNLRTFKN